MAEYDQLPERVKAALWHYMVEDGGVEDTDYDEHVRKYTYTLCSYSPRSVVSAWKNMGWRTAGQGPRAKLDPHDEKRVRNIERLRTKGQHVWPYIVGSGTSFKEWASDEMNRFHRAMASPPNEAEVPILRRVQWARAAVQAYLAQTLDDEENAVADLLGDLMHYCDAHNLDFEYDLERARDSYQEELEEAQPPP